MRIESIKVQNYRVFQNVEVNNIPNMAVFLGMNGVGKTTFFDVFGFLHGFHPGLFTLAERSGKAGTFVCRGAGEPAISTTPV